MINREASMCRAAFILAALLPLTTIAATGPVWWNELGVDPDEYSCDWFEGDKLYEYKRVDSFPRQAARLAEDLAHVPLENLFARCEAVIAAGLAAEKEREQRTDGSLRDVPQSWFGGPRVRDWLLCAATMRRMGESDSQNWVPVLERLYGQWKGAVGCPNQDGWVPGRLGHSVWGVLRTETEEAYQRLVLRDMDLGQIAGALQYAFAEEFRNWSELQIAASSTYRTRLSRAGPWPEEYRALWTHPDPEIRLRMLGSTPIWFIPPEEHLFYVSLLTDPDPRVQHHVWGVLTAEVYQRTPVIPALQKLLERDDMDDRVRRMAEDGIRSRGYAVKRTAEGLVLERDEDERILAALEWLDDSDDRWRGQAYHRLRDLTSSRRAASLSTVLDFLAREEIGDTARTTATRLLRDRGYVPATADDGSLMAVPAEGGPPIRQRTPDAK